MALEGDKGWVALEGLDAKDTDEKVISTYGHEDEDEARGALGRLALRSHDAPVRVSKTGRPVASVISLDLLHGGEVVTSLTPVRAFVEGLRIRDVAFDVRPQGLEQAFGANIATRRIEKRDR